MSADHSTLKALLFVSSGLSPIDAEKMRQAAIVIEDLEKEAEDCRACDCVPTTFLRDAETKIKRLEGAIRWVMNDARYKAPEQINTLLVGFWIAHLNDALTSGTSKGDE